MAGSNKTSSHSSSKKSHHASLSSSTMRPDSTRSHGEARPSSSRAQHHGNRHPEDNHNAIDRYIRSLDRIEHFLNRNENYPLRGSTSRQEDSQRTIQYYDRDMAHASNHNSQSHSNGGGHHGNNDSRRHSNSGHSDVPHHRSSGSSSGSNSRHPNPYAEPYYYPDASGEPRSQRGSGQNHKSHSGDKDHHKGGHYHR